jgi:hypothetical protein
MACQRLGLAGRPIASAGRDRCQLRLLLSKQAFNRLPLDRIRLGRQESLKMRDVQVYYGSVHDRPQFPCPAMLPFGSGSDIEGATGA